MVSSKGTPDSCVCYRVQARAIAGAMPAPSLSPAIAHQDVLHPQAPEDTMILSLQYHE